MVKLKVQSAQDIIAACLDCLGLAKGTAQIFADAYPQLSSGNDIPAETDEIIYHKAKKIFKTKMPKTQLVALYKAVYINLDCAKKYGVAPLLPDFDNADFDKSMRDSAIIPAPSYKLSEMPTQEISPIHFRKNKSAKKGEKL